jgi:ribonuclease VapC
LILDSSALIAILFRERRHERLREAMFEAEFLGIGTPTLVESTMVATGSFESRGRRLVLQLMEEFEVEAVQFDSRHARVAAEAFLRYGKGRHPAALNYGDCMTYATARLADLPLLFKGKDFARTDIAAAL